MISLPDLRTIARREWLDDPKHTPLLEKKLIAWEERGPLMHEHGTTLAGIRRPVLVLTDAGRELLDAVDGLERDLEQCRADLTAARADCTRHEQAVRDARRELASVSVLLPGARVEE